MNAQDLTLNIAVNLGRLARWANEGKVSRIEQFLAETERYLRELEEAPKSDKLIKTVKDFRNVFEILKNKKNYDANWAEDALTWANILAHRAKLA